MVVDAASESYILGSARLVPIKLVPEHPDGFVYERCVAELCRNRLQGYLKVRLSFIDYQNVRMLG
jgi:hypothetical protein